MHNWKRLYVLFGVLIMASLVLAACPSSAPAPESAGSGDEAVAEEAAEEATPEAEEEAEAEAAPEEMSERAKTLIMDIDGGRSADPELWNTFVPGARLDHVEEQALAAVEIRYLTGASR